MRINKYIAEAGYCSRREADALIKKGAVKIDGRNALCGDQVTAGMTVTIDGKVLAPPDRKVYLAYHKPRGVVCTAEKREKNNIMAVLDYPVRVTYAGRLDKESEGLLLLTNDGDLIDRLMRGRNGHEREYAVRVDKPLTPDFLKKMKAGIYLKELDETTRPCKVRRITDRTFEIVLTQGLNRQIRRMCEACGYHVRELKRIRIANILLGRLKTGQLRELTAEELQGLFGSLGEE
ncbi:MAG: pseudouridine synthase [Lachnospiraceae bacterium]|nr:pseudouridine synthase [Lachnospiraceae bacterium]